MSILKALQDWLSGYPGMQLQPLTDMTKAKAPGYAIAPTGNGETVKDITGACLCRNSYVFYAKECVQDEADRSQNYDFLEGLAAWITEQSNSSAVPDLPGGFEIEDIKASNIFLMDIGQDGLGLYQIQIQLTITRRGF